MAFSIPSFTTILSRVKGDLESEVAGADAHLPSTPEYMFARVLSQLSKGLHAHILYWSRQLFPDTADAVNFWRWAAVWGITQKAATAWEGTITPTGVATTPIPAGTQWSRSDGYVYESEDDYEVGDTIPIVATDDYLGAAGNNDDGQTLTLVSPIVDVDSDVTVDATTVEASDQETKAEGLIRLLQRIRNPPSAGGPGDYVRWALEVSGFTRAWEFANVDGVGVVSVVAVRDGDSPINPDAGERATLLAYLETVAPITVGLSVTDVSLVTVDVTLSALTPNTAAVKAAIEAQIEDLLLREGGPGITIALSQITEAIASATGEQSHVMSSPSADLIFATDEVPVFGTLTTP